MTKNHEYYATLKELKQLKEEIVLSRGLKCPNCDDTGGFPNYDSHGEIYQCQCQFCYEVKDSIFNRSRKK
jgi:hypothetical protein